MYHSGTLVNKLTLKANEYVFGLNLKRLFSICLPPYPRLAPRPFQHIAMLSDYFVALAITIEQHSEVV